MRVFVHEFVTSGALSNRELPPSLLREGLAMRTAVVASLLELDGVSVSTTRDARVRPACRSRLEEWIVEKPEEEGALFQSLCRESDLTIVIAPELDGELVRRVHQAAALSSHGRVWNAHGVLEAAADKWETFLRLRAADVPVIETRLASTDWPADRMLVLKRRDGAGSQEMRRIGRIRARESVRCSGDLNSIPRTQSWGFDCDCNTLLTGDPEAWVVQPYVEGRGLSCCVLFGGDGQIADVFPPAEQRLSGDGRFTYLGGRIPARDCDSEAVQSLAERAVQVLTVESGLPNFGPVGVDIVENARTGELIVCEVNPRFTTSFVGYRSLTAPGFLSHAILGENEPIAWRSGSVEFDAAGRVTANAR